MKEIIKSKIVVAPLPVFIIATYDADGKPDAMNADGQPNVATTS